MPCHVILLVSLAAASAAERDLDRLQCIVCFGAVESASLRHIRPAATTLATQCFGTFFDKIDSVEPLGQVVRNAHHNARLAVFGGGNDDDDTGPDLAFAFVGETAQILSSIPDTARARSFTPLICLTSLASPDDFPRRPWPASFWRQTGRARVSSLIQERTDTCGISSSGTLSSAAAALTT